MKQGGNPPAPQPSPAVPRKKKKKKETEKPFVCISKTNNSKTQIGNIPESEGFETKEKTAEAVRQSPFYFWRIGVNNNLFFETDGD